MGTLPPLLCTSCAIEWKILQDASEFLAPDKFPAQVLALDFNAATLVSRPFSAKEMEHRSVGTCLQNLIYICFPINYIMTSLS